MAARSNLRDSMLAGAAAAAILAGSPALAQGQDRQPPAQGLEELVVTAQKHEQATIDVPIALTAYSGRDLDRLGVQQFDQLSLFVPGFEVQNQSPNDPGFVMRGITSDSGASTQEPRVSVFQDGVSISKSRGSFVELFDLDRIEVAKGPQSTLFGRGALIGAVNLVQAKADPAKFDYAARLEGGSYAYHLFDAMVNVPLGDTFAVRLSGRTKKRDGYVDDALGGDAFNSLATDAARLALKWRPSARASFDVIVNYQQDFPTGTSFKSLAFSPTNPVTGQVLAGRAPWDPAALAAAPGFEGGRDLGLRRFVWGTTGLADFKLSDALTLSSITGFRRFQSEEVFDADGISLPLLTAAEDARGRQWSQEVRLRYDGGGIVSGFAGVDYFWEKGSQRGPAQFDERVALTQFTGQLSGSALGLGPAASPAPAPVFANPAFTGALLQGAAASLSGGRLLLAPALAQALAGRLRGDFIETSTNGSTLRSWDLFADVTLHPTDRIELSGGLRYTTDDKTTRFSSAVVGGRSVLGGVIGAAQLAASGSPAAVAAANQLVQGLAAFGSSLAAPLPYFALSAQPTAGNGAVVAQSLSDDGITWRLVGRYKLSPETNLYASYSRGRRPDVLSAGAPNQPFGAPRFTLVPAETVDSFEAGAKTVIGGRLRLDGSAYYYAYDNFQTVQQQGTLFVTTNAGKARAYGVELQADWAATPMADLYLTYAYSHARFDGGAYDGNRFRLSPDHKLSLAGSFRAAGLGGVFDLRPSLTWQSRIFFDDNNDKPQFQQPPQAFVADNIQDELQNGYALANLRLAYGPAGGPWRIEAFVSNLFDKKYVKDAGNTGDSLGLPTFIAGEPRFFGVAFSLRR